MLPSPAPPSSPLFLSISDSFQFLLYLLLLTKESITHDVQGTSLWTALITFTTTVTKTTLAFQLSRRCSLGIVKQSLPRFLNDIKFHFI